MRFWCLVTNSIFLLAKTRKFHGVKSALPFPNSYLGRVKFFQHTRTCICPIIRDRGGPPGANRVKIANLYIRSAMSARNTYRFKRPSLLQLISGGLLKTVTILLWNFHFEPARNIQPQQRLTSCGQFFEVATEFPMLDFKVGVEGTAKVEGLQVLWMTS